MQVFCLWFLQKRSRLIFNFRLWNQQNEKQRRLSKKLKQQRELRKLGRLTGKNSDQHWISFNMSLHYLQAGDENEENHQTMIALMCILILSTFSKFTKQKLTTDSKNKVVCSLSTYWLFQKQCFNYIGATLLINLPCNLTEANSPKKLNVCSILNSVNRYTAQTCTRKSVCY